MKDDRSRRRQPTSDAPNVKRSGRVRGWAASAAPPLVVGVIGLGIWQLASTIGPLPDSIPPPTEIAGFLGEKLRTRAAWTTMLETMHSWVVGFVVTVLIGTFVGGIAGLSDIGKRMVSGLVEFCRPIPSVIFIPVVVIAFGTDRTGVVLLVVLSAVWPVLLQTTAGLRDTDPVLWDVAGAYRFTPTQRLLHCIVPSTIPFLATGVRIAATISLVVVITVEMLGTGRGIGGELARGLQTGDYSRLYGWACLAAFIGLLIDSLLGNVERRVLRWHPSVRAEVQA